ncbi:hypothetical protein ZWY2020_051969 [Hordeum vulgare]|nr:hypothetical protein ZWY2020_051969 [Hordeum vulgare]
MGFYYMDDDAAANIDHPRPANGEPVEFCSGAYAFVTVLFRTSEPETVVDSDTAMNLTELEEIRGAAGIRILVTSDAADGCAAEWRTLVSLLPCPFGPHNVLPKDAPSSSSHTTTASAIPSTPSPVASPTSEPETVVDSDTALNLTELEEIRAAAGNRILVTSDAADGCAAEWRTLASLLPRPFGPRDLLPKDTPSDSSHTTTASAIPSTSSPMASPSAT